jgi:hypothetical protein
MDDPKFAPESQHVYNPNDPEGRAHLLRILQDITEAVRSGDEVSLVVLLIDGTRLKTGQLVKAEHLSPVLGALSDIAVGIIQASTAQAR